MKIISQDALMGWLVGCTIAVVLVSVFLLVRGVDKQTKVAIGDSTLSAKIADTAPARSNGLSGTPSLKESQAMLFVFDYPSSWPIWMQGMRYPIDVIWLDKNKTVVDIEAELSPSSFPNSFEPNQAALYVLEVSSGFAQKHGVHVGAEAKFELPH